jgi:exonuclease III
MTSISIATWNVNGCRDALKRHDVFNHLKINQNADFYFLQETHTLPADEAQWQIVWRAPILFSHADSNSAGVAILTHPRKLITINSSHNIVDGQFNSFQRDVPPNKQSAEKIKQICFTKDRVFTSTNDISCNSSHKHNTIKSSVY